MPVRELLDDLRRLSGSLEASLSTTLLRVNEPTTRGWGNHFQKEENDASLGARFKSRLLPYSGFEPVRL